MCEVELSLPEPWSLFSLCLRLEATLAAINKIFVWNKFKYMFLVWGIFESNSVMQC